MTERGVVPEHGGHHGKATSWILVAVMIAAFAAGGASLILGSWLAFFVSVGVFVLCVPIGWAIGIMDDTIAWTLPWSEARSLQEETAPPDESPAVPTEPATDAERR